MRDGKLHSSFDDFIYFQDRNLLSPLPLFEIETYINIK